MNQSTKTPDLLRLAQVLFYLNAGIWLLFGIVSLARISATSADLGITAWVIAIMMFGNAAAMLVSGVGLGTQRRGFYYLAIAVLLVNIVLTVTDEFGLFDLITGLIDLLLLGILVALRRRI